MQLQTHKYANLQKKSVNLHIHSINLQIMVQIKRYYPSILITLAVIILSLVPMPEVPQLGYVPLWDKWVHFVMYGGLCLVYWFDFHRNKHSKKAWRKWLLWIVLFPIALGGLMELGQAYLTTCRNGDWIDFIANTIGVLLALPVGLFLMKRK